MKVRQDHREILIFKVFLQISLKEGIYTWGEYLAMPLNPTS